MRPSAVILIVVVSLAACGSDDEQTSAPTKPTPTATASPSKTAAPKPDAAADKADKAIKAGQRFFLRMDDDAIALEDAVKAAQDGDSSAVDRIARLRSRISKRLNAYLFAGGDTSIGGNLLLSAATTAREAATSGDVARLADQRREIADARTKLAEEAVK